MSSISNDYATNGILSIGKTLYLNEKFSDLRFIFNSSDRCDEIIPVHKSFLAAVSNKFDNLFSDSWKGKVDVVIPDATAAEFREFLQFFYLERATLTMDNIKKVMCFGKEYNVPECMNACVKFLQRNLTEDNICWGYDLAISYDQIALQRFCKIVIAINTEKVFSSASFLTCKKETLGNILEMESLSCSEAEVFKACMRWVKNVSKNKLTREIIQVHLGELFFKIRFNSMTLHQFADLIRNNIIPFENLPFSEMIKCDRLLSLDYARTPYYIKSVEKTQFSINHPMLLKQIECSIISIYASNQYYPVEDLQTELEIIQVSVAAPDGDKVVLHRGNYHLTNFCARNITLTKPILVRPGFLYEIQLKQSPPPNCSTGDILKLKVQLDSNINVQFHHDSYMKIDKVARGVVRKLGFHRI
ncbi:BTB/POZ domain-containing protein 2-like isoform X2 [Contarinia nasturtii]|uniref:BTB/POZ domain-containing protein 2-like isoform X2 n=1 Tax=Contarinia nasturtii TaxID=265458 RepID=UPI0012D3A47A|nr:BTB/POZ domain-containing protein 2-like isoform X2 [Contarinia nasturtii]